MLLLEIKQLVEMARPAKICDKCGKSMAGHHYWYKGGWKCKKASLEAAKSADNKSDKKEEKKSEKPAQKPAEKREAPKKEEPKKAAPAAAEKEDDEKKDHKGVVKGMEREAGEEKDDDVKTAEKVEQDVKKKKSVKAGETISAAEMRDVTADDEAEARKQINDMFPKASAENKARAMNVWKARHKKKD